jgi:hypothetical protein
VVAVSLGAVVVDAKDDLVHPVGVGVP